MIDDLQIIANLVWGELLKAIPLHLKVKETDRKVYIPADAIGFDAQGNRKRSSSHIWLKYKAEIYTHWYEEYVEVKILQPSMRMGMYSTTSIHSRRSFTFKQENWLEEMLEFTMTAVAVFDASFHILEGKDFKVWSPRSARLAIMKNLTQET